MKEIPGFKMLKALHHGRCWYIVDCTESERGREPHTCTIGGYHLTYAALCLFAYENYTGIYL